MIAFLPPSTSPKKKKPRETIENNLLAPATAIFMHVNCEFILQMNMRKKNRASANEIPRQQ